MKSKEEIQKRIKSILATIYIEDNKQDEIEKVYEQATLEALEWVLESEE